MAHPLKPSLPPPVVPSHPSGDLFARPGGPLEAAIAGAWRSALGLDAVGVHDTFIALGGDSISAMQVLSRLRRELSVSLTLRDLFAHPTVAELATLVAERRAGSGLRVTEPLRADHGASAPLSFEQEGIWFAQHLQPDSSAYNIVDGRWLNGHLDVDAFRRALDALADRHDALRTRFALGPAGPEQQVVPRLDPAFDLVDLSTGGAGARARAIDEARAFSRLPFDLGAPPLWRVRLWRTSPRAHLALLGVHHIIFDDWSIAAFWQQMAELYNAIRRGRAPALAPLPLQFTDFARRQRARLTNLELTRQLEYWTHQLADLAPTELATDAPRPAVQTYRGAVVTRPFGRDLCLALRRFGVANGVTPYTTLLAAFCLLLSRYANQEAVAVGVPLATRERDATEALIGTFVNTHVIRVRIDRSRSFRDLVAQAREVTLDAHDHKDVSFASLVAAVNPHRDPSRSPLYQVMFNFIAGPLPTVELDGLSMRSQELDSGGAQVDLTFTAIINDALQAVSVNYNADLFTERTIVGLLERFELALTRALAQPDRSIASLSLMTAAEAHALARVNDTRAPFPTGVCLHQLFERQAAATPDAPALFAGDRTVTFRELDRLANRFARRLRELGVTTETMVGLGLERSPEHVAALLGILKAGGACVPLDPSYPPARLAQNLEDARPPVLIARDGTAGRFPGYQGRLLSPESLGPTAATDDEPLDVEVRADQVAFVHFTSGSSGPSNGVLGLHEGSVNRLQWLWRHYPFEAGEVCCALAPAVFVDSVREVLGPLLRGVPLVLVPESIVGDPFAFVDLLARRRVSRLNIVPSLLSTLLDARQDLASILPALRSCFASGEALLPSLVERCRARLPDVRLVNLYGCSEASGDSTCFEVPAAGVHGDVPLGRPLDNQRIYVLDAALEPVPPGMVGEICIGGVGLARGYLNRPQLTAARFVADPFGQPGDRLYRTGDLGVWSADGTLRYLGRRDRQVKVRGIRVELDAVEAELRSVPSVRDAAVVLDPATSQSLAAYVVPAGTDGIDVSALKASLRSRVPPHMVPAVVVTLDALPLLPNGKVDRRALSHAVPAAHPQHAAFVAPATRLERSLADVWRRVLKVERVGVHDNFFDIGGHSLLAVRLVAEIERTLGVRVPLIWLMRGPTVSELAGEIERPREAPAQSTLVRLQPAGIRPPFFCVHGIDGGTWGYEPLARLLGPERPFYGLEAHGVDGRSEPDRSIEAMAARYLDALTAVWPVGPVMLGGYSFGGYVALDMARQLAGAGRPVSKLVMIDTPAPKSDYSQFRTDLRSLLRAAANAPWWLADFATLEPSTMVRRVRRRARGLRRRPPVSGYEGTIDLGAFHDRVDAYPAEIQRLIEVFARALVDYVVRPYPGRVTLIRARTQPLLCSHDRTMGWAALATGGVEVVTCPGSHRTLLRPPYIAGVARRLGALLD